MSRKVLKFSISLHGNCQESAIIILEAMSFAVAFDLALRSADRSLIDLAAQTRLPASTLSRLRTGRRLPTEAHLAALAKALRLSADEAARWRDLALVDRAPAPVRERLRQAPAVRGEGFHDGWWIGYCRTFRDDGGVARFLVRFHGDHVLVQVHDRGVLQMRYPGTCETFGESLFVRATDDRGGSEHLQIVLHSLSAFREPTVLHGVVCGVTPRDLAHPVSLPCAARVVLLHAGDLALPAAPLRSLQGRCGTFAPEDLGEVWPEVLGDATAIRRALAPAAADPTAAVLRLTDNHLPVDRHVLRAGGL